MLSEYFHTEDEEAGKKNHIGYDVEGPSLMVQLEAWENQRFRPLLGWTHTVLNINSTPFTRISLASYQLQSMPQPFSDITGTTPVPSEINNGTLKPKNSIPELEEEGWKWQTDWEIDMNTGGKTESQDGWFYGSTFESLVKANISRTPAAKVKTLSVVRRRKWIRTKICVSQTARNRYLAAVRRVRSICSNMARVSLQLEQDCEELKAYEDQRLSSHNRIINEIDQDLFDTLALLSDVEEKLKAMVCLLEERGAMEREYASQLQRLSAKWMNVGSNSKFKSSEISANQAAESSVRRPSFNSQFIQTDDNHSNSGFFHLFSTANEAVAERLASFASILMSSLPADVSNVLLEVQSIRHDCTQEDGPYLRACLLRCHTRASTDLKTFFTAVQYTKTYLEFNKAAFERQLASKAADLPINRTTIQDVDATTTFSNEIPENSNVQSSAVFSRDTWLALQFYKQMTIEWEAYLLAYQAFITQQRKAALLTMSKVASLLHSTVKVVAHEQMRAWVEASQILNAAVSPAQSLEKDIHKPDIIHYKDSELPEGNQITKETINEIEEPQGEVIGSLPDYRILFPSSVSARQYISISGHVRYSVNWSPPTQVLGNAKSIDDYLVASTSTQAHLQSFIESGMAEWIDGRAFLTIDSILHIFPVSVSNKDEYLLAERPAAVLSINISGARISPLLLPLPGIAGEVICLQPPRTDRAIDVIHGEKFDVQTMSYSQGAASALLRDSSDSVRHFTSDISKRLSSFGLMSDESDNETKTRDIVFNQSSIRDISLLLPDSVIAAAWIRAVVNPFNNDADFQE